MNATMPAATPLTFRCPACGSLNRVADASRKTPICGRCKERLNVTGAPQPVTAEELRDAIARAPVPVLVDVWAPWCGPCRVAGPMFERIARERAGKVIALKLDSEDNPDAAAKHRIQGIPTFLIFRGGAEAARQVGLPSAAAFAQWVDGFLR